MRTSCSLLAPAALLLAAAISFAGESAQPCKSPGKCRLIRVAAVQMEGVAGGIQPNLEKATELIEQAAARGARYILFPEVYALFPDIGSARSLEEARRLAEPVPGPVTDHMLALARKLQVNIALGMAEKRGDKLYNSVVFVSPGGIAGVYSKRALVTHASMRAWSERLAGKPLPDYKEPETLDEATTFAPGEGNGLFAWGGVKTGALICADGGFDGFWGWLAVNGAELVCFPSASGGKPEPGQRTVAEIARKHRLPILFANHIRHAILFFGNSQIVDARGRVLANAGTDFDQVIVADLALPAGKASAGG
jgi:predicted amidohydrolase